VELKTYFAQDSAGNIIPSASVTIYESGTTNIVSGLKTAGGADLSNPFNSETSGRIQFRAPDGMYDMLVSKDSTIMQKVAIQCVDYAEFKQTSEQANDAVNSINGMNNNLFDPFFEILINNPTLGGKTHIQSGSLVAASGNHSPFGYPAIVAGPASGAIASRNIWLADCGIQVADVINIHTTAWYANAGGRIAYIFRNASGTIIGSQVLDYAQSTGANSFTKQLTVPETAVRLEVRVENTANAGSIEIALILVSKQSAANYPAVPVRPESPYPIPAGTNSVGTAAIQKQAVTVDKANFFVPGKNLFDKSAATLDSYVDYTTGTIKANATYAASDFIAVTPGNTYTQGYSHQTAYYDANKAYVSGVNVATSPTTPRALVIPAGVAFVRMTVLKTGLDTMQFEAGAEATDYQAYNLYLDSSRIDPSIANQGAEQQYVERAYQVRVGRMKLSQLASSVSAILNIGFIGDSWTQLATRYTQPLANALRKTFGSGPGIGWVSFGRHNTSASIINGSVFSTGNLATQFTWSAGWQFSYSGTKNPTNSSPDTAVVTSSTVGDVLTATVPGTANGGWSTCRLGYVGTADGVIRYKWDNGAWTNLNVQGSGLLFTDINPPATIGASNVLTIEVVSGTVSLCGINCISTGAGVRFYKLGASGSSIASWLTMDQAAFTAALTELALDTVVLLFGTNDQRITGGASAFETNMRSLIARVKTALPAADIMIVMPCENTQAGQQSTMANMAKRAQKVAKELNCTFLNLQYIFGENVADYANGSNHSWFASDGIHPDPSTGGYLIKDAIYRALVNR